VRWADLKVRLYDLLGSTIEPEFEIYFGAAGAGAGAAGAALFAGAGAPMTIHGDGPRVREDLVVHFPAERF
jgi:hypothetical protein